MALELVSVCPRPAAAISEPKRFEVCKEAGKLNLRRLFRLLGRSRRFAPDMDEVSDDVESIWEGGKREEEVLNRSSMKCGFRPI